MRMLTEARPVRVSIRVAMGSSLKRQLGPTRSRDTTSPAGEAGHAKRRNETKE